MNTNTARAIAAYLTRHVQCLTESMILDGKLPKDVADEVRELSSWINTLTRIDGENMKPKHTPGPWTAIEAGSRERVIGPQRRAIAETLTSVEGDGAANARLMSAAPELLKAVERLIEFAVTPDLKAEITWWPEVEAALRKARGE